MQPSIFADGMIDASVTHGVARITLGQTVAEGKVLPAGQLVMPLTQVPSLVNGLVALMKQIEAKVKEAQSQQAQSQQGQSLQGQAGGNTDDTTPGTGSFRFSG